MRVAADATAALAVWALVRPAAGDRWALAAWLAAAVTVAQPTSANPFPVALALALCAVLAAARGRPVAGGAARRARGVLAARHRRGRRRSRRSRRCWPRRRRPRGGLRRAAAAAAAAHGGARGRGAVRAVRGRGGPGRLWDELVGIAAGDGELWRLPFPLGYDGPLRGWPPSALAEDLKDVLGLLPAAGGARARRARADSSVVRRRPGPGARRRDRARARAARCTCSRAPTTCTRSRWSCACARRCRSPPPRAARRALGRRAARRAVLAAGLALIVLAGAANRLSALLLPPDLEPVHLAGRAGDPRAAGRGRRAAADGRARAAARAAGEPIYVAPRRSDLVTISDPLIHFLVRRPNMLAPRRQRPGAPARAGA